MRITATITLARSTKGEVVLYMNDELQTFRTSTAAALVDACDWLTSWAYDFEGDDFDLDDVVIDHGTGCDGPLNCTCGEVS